jgi:DNA repair protein RadC
LEATAGDPRVAELLHCVQNIVGHVLRCDIEERPLIGNEPAVIAYLRSRCGHSRNEEVRVLYLGSKNHLVHEQVFPGTIDEAPFQVREILRRGLDVGAASLVVAHNHPSGEARASEADREMTQHLVRAGHEVGISVLDHIIVTRTGSLSFRLGGLL